MGLLGQVVSHYRVSDGRGTGMGVFFEAEDSRLEHPVAIKFLLATTAITQQALGRFSHAKLVGGEPTFPRATGALTYTAILRNEPVPPPQLNPDLPRDPEGIIMKVPENYGARARRRPPSFGPI